MISPFKLLLVAISLVSVGQSAIIDLQARQTGKTLTILPLGDSITFGLGTSDGNAYRQALRTLLVNKSNTINFIGTVKSGNMADNENEGRSGYTIDQSRTHSGTTTSLATQPNVVLLHIGTNDIFLNTNVGQAPTRLGTYIDAIFTAAPNTTLLVAQIIRLNDANAQNRITAYNNAIPAIVAQRRNAGKKVAVVDFSTALNSGDLADGVHPNVAGYTKMANVWATALQAAADAGFI